MSRTQADDDMSRAIPRTDRKEQENMKQVSLAHEVVYHMTGKYPVQVLFKNGNPRDCRRENLVPVWKDDQSREK